MEDPFTSVRAYPVLHGIGVRTVAIELVGLGLLRQAKTTSDSDTAASLISYPCSKAIELENLILYTMEDKAHESSDLSHSARSFCSSKTSMASRPHCLGRLHERHLAGKSGV